MKKEAARPSPLDCLMVTFYFTPRLGGIENYVERLATALSRRISIQVLAPRVVDDGKYDPSLPFPVLRVPLMAKTISSRPLLFKPFYPLVSLLFFVRIFTQFRHSPPRLICSGSADFAFAIAVAARLIGSEFVFICHGKDVHVRGPLSFLFKRLPLRYAMRWAKAIFVNSHFTQSLLDPNREVADRIFLLPPPVPPKQEIAPREEDLNRARQVRSVIGPDARILLSAGRLREHKGHQFVIGALAMLKDEFPDLIYVIVGEGPYENVLREEAARQGIQERVIFAGRTAGPPDAFYSIADLFVTVTWAAPGEFEGFGTVFIEAARYGIPAIAGDVGGMTESVIHEKTGLCVRTGSAEAIADAIRRLMRDEALRKKMGESAVEHARSFEPSRIADQFLRACGLDA